MIVVCGEALMDVFSAGSTAAGLQLDARIGGSPLNVAMGLARLGQPVAFFGGVSSGFLGERLWQFLHDEGISTVCTQRLDAPTTLSLVGLDARGVPSYAFYGDGAADRLLDEDALATVPRDARALHFGSYAMAVNPVGATQRALIERERQRALISWDPNVRLNVEPRLEVWRELVDWMLPRVHLLKVSDEDLGLLYPGQAPDALAAQWLERGVKLVVVTRGGHGALGFTSGHSVSAAAKPVQLVDTVGAGDTFQAALLTWLAEQDRLSASRLGTLRPGDLAAMLDFAMQAAAITCSRRGADLPRRGQLPA